MLKTFKFDNDEIQNFLQYFFLSEITVEKKRWTLKFYYTEIDLTLDFTQKLEYYFKLKFPGYLVCKYEKILRRKFNGRKNIRNTDGEIWDKNLKPLFPIPQTEREKLLLKALELLSIDENFIPFETLSFHNDFYHVKPRKRQKISFKNFPPIIADTPISDDIETTPKNFHRNSEQVKSDAPVNVVNTVHMLSLIHI